MHISKIETCSWPLSSSFGLDANERVIFFGLFVNGLDTMSWYILTVAAILRTTIYRTFDGFTWFSIVIRMSIYTQSTSTPKQRRERKNDKINEMKIQNDMLNNAMSINRNCTFILNKKKSIYINICSAHSCNDKNHMQTNICIHMCESTGPSLYGA